ncbi:SCO3242 family prenyltransferase [Streptomyces phaeoluteigriseus]
MHAGADPASTTDRARTSALSSPGPDHRSPDPGSPGPRTSDRRSLTSRTPDLRAWAELLRVPALFTVPGDVLAGTAAVTARPDRRTVLAIASSVCLYEAGMALNDWADREEDAAERPHRPLPSGRVRPAAALGAAGALTAAGLALAARAGRPALTVAAPLAATVWSYDLLLKRTPAGPFAMAAARGLDLLLGAAATGGRVRPALPSAVLLSTHTLAVTTVSRHETRDGTPTAPLAALATTGALAWLLHHRPPDHRPPDHRPPDHRPPDHRRLDHRSPLRQRHPGRAAATTTALTAAATTTALTAAYVATVARPYFHAVLNPSPPLTQRAVGAGIRATIPLQSALAARSGAVSTALFTAALAPVARRLAKRVSVT